jgi:hypothetical protein
MHDIEIDRDGRLSALEVTAVADGETIAFWDLATGRGRWIEEGLEGGWVVAFD